MKVFGYCIALIAIAAVAYVFFIKSLAIPEPAELIVTLSEQNNSTEYGTAVLTEKDGKAIVTLELLGAPADTIQPAHIHEGTCASLGAPRYQLKFPINGASETQIDVSLARLMRELPLAINVHKSVAEPTIYVACGDIQTPAE